MSIKNSDTTKIRNILNERINNFDRKKRKQTTTIMIFWVSVILVLTILIFTFVKPYDVNLRGLIISFVTSIVLVNWFINIPFLAIMAIIVYRTRSKSFLYQFIPQLGFQILITLAVLSNYIQLDEDSPFMPIYIVFLLLLVAFECIFLFLYVRGIRENQKPIFFWTFFQDSLEAYCSTLLTQQALFIDDYQNGFSQRPFFIEFPEILSYCSTKREFHHKMMAYANFLAEKSELIGWDVNNGKISVYPRVLLGSLDKGLGIQYLWRQLKRIYTKKGLTKITVDFDSTEINLIITRDAYDLLDDVTYHLLGDQILKKFKQSLVTFMEGNFDEAYALLFPLKTI